MTWNPINDEVFVAVLYVCLDVFVEFNVVSVWFSNVVYSALTVCMYNNVCFWLVFGVADCLSYSSKFGLDC